MQQASDNWGIIGFRISQSIRFRVRTQRLLGWVGSTCFFFPVASYIRHPPKAPCHLQESYSSNMRSKAQNKPIGQVPQDQKKLPCVSLICQYIGTTYMTIFPSALTNQNTERHTPWIGEYSPLPMSPFFPSPTEGVPMSFFSSCFSLVWSAGPSG